MSILMEADIGINGEKATEYGPPRKNLGHIAEQWSLYINQRTPSQFTIELKPEDVCWMMTLLKMTRNMHKTKRDNIVDAAGYIGLIEKTCLEMEQSKEKTAKCVSWHELGFTDESQ